MGNYHKRVIARERMGMMEYLKLCDSDYRFMLIVWEAAPVNSGELSGCVMKNWGGKSQQHIPR